jgi:hypothetical protein
LADIWRVQNYRENLHAVLRFHHDLGGAFDHDRLHALKLHARVFTHTLKIFMIDSSDLRCSFLDEFYLSWYFVSLGFGGLHGGGVVDFDSNGGACSDESRDEEKNCVCCG